MYKSLIMSSNKENRRTCFLCYQKYKIGKENSDGNRKLADEIFVIFLLRNVLEIPKSFCEVLLIKKGNPSEWIFCCPACSKTIHDLKNVFRELTIIQKKYDLLKQKVTLILRHSKSVCVTEESQTAEEIRNFIFTGDHLHHYDLLYDKEGIKWESEELLDVKTEVASDSPLNDELFSDFGENRYDISSPAEIPNMTKKNHSKQVKTTRELRKRKSNVSKNKESDDDFSPSEVDLSGSDSDWESANDTNSEKSEEENNDTKSIEIPAKKKRNIKAKLYSCLICKESFKGIRKFRKHNKDEHGMNKWFTCGHCDAIFATSDEGKEHYKTTHPTEIVKIHEYRGRERANVNICMLCGEHLKKAGEMKRHMQNFHNDLKCEICNKTFQKVKDLAFHRRGFHFKELNLEPFQCKICQKTFKNPKNLKSHMTARHTLDFRVFCSICKQGALNSTALKYHISRVHNNDKPFSCKFCEKRFITKVAMERHAVVLHTKKFKFNCEICCKGYLFKTELENHTLASHSNAPKPFPCELCSASFMEKHELEKHQRGRHYKELNLEPYKCDECGKMFNSISGMKRHVKQEHTKAFKFICNECGKQYLSKGEFDRHVRRQHKQERECLCTVCGKSYFEKRSLEAHMQRQHTKEFSHRCTLCPDKGYADNWRLQRHIKMSHPEIGQDTNTTN